MNLPLLLPGGLLVFVFYLLLPSRVDCWWETCPKGKPAHSTRDLQDTLKSKLFGQHMIVEKLPTLIDDHLVNEYPKKPLVLSFQGGAGTGKTHAIEMVAKYLYDKGNFSTYFHRKTFGRDYLNEHKVATYKKEMEAFMDEKATLCDTSLFIFELSSDTLPQVVNILKPYLHGKGTKENRKIIIFHSSVGSGALAKRLSEHLQSGKKRKDIQSNNLEDNLRNGCKRSSLSSVCHLVDSFLPFLPLESRHVRQCVLEHLCQREPTTCGGHSLKKVYDLDKVVQARQRELNIASSHEGLASLGCHFVREVVLKF